MKANNTNKKNVKTSTQTKQNGPGRPRYATKWPRGKFTFTDLEIENEVDPNTGKGKNCTTLTLRKALKRELANRKTGAVLQLKGTLAEPNSKAGLGRKQFVYARRTVAEKMTAKGSAPRKTVEPSAASVAIAESPAPESVEVTATDVSQETKDYEALKASLLSIPAVTITPDQTPSPTDVPSEVAAAASSAEVAPGVTA
jgi:hypothetical protein